MRQLSREAAQRWPGGGVSDWGGSEVIYSQLFSTMFDTLVLIQPFSFKLPQGIFIFLILNLRIVLDVPSASW
jgi:hypothetical protein